MKMIELIARGVLKHKERILLVRQKGGTYTFLPGGHIEFGEPAKVALTREINEELGLSAEVKKLLGVVEHSWRNGDDLKHELNLIFSIVYGNFNPDQPPMSREEHLEFLWHPLHQLESVNLQPYPLRKLLPLWLQNDVTNGWCSTLEDE